MYPHERSLVKKMEGKPFALVGVNSDQNKEDLKKAMEKEHITWRSFWNGGSPGGPISTAWNVHGWPTLYILDQKGTIRHKHLGSPGDEVLDKEIEKLVQEAEKEVKR
jgi:Thioredoxin-like